MRKIWKRLTAACLSLFLFAGFVPVSAETIYNDKISEYFQEILSELEDDDMVLADISLTNISEEELDALMLAETEYDPADFVNGHPDKELKKAYEAARQDIKDREMKNKTDAFCEKYLGDDYFIRIAYMWGNIDVEVTKADILRFAELDEVKRISGFLLPEEMMIFNHGEEILSLERAEILAELFIESGYQRGAENRKPEEVEIEYFGTYGGYEVVGLTYWDMVHFSDGRIPYQGAGEYQFYADYWNTTRTTGIFVCKDEELILLENAYSEGLLTDEDLARLAQNHPRSYHIVDEFPHPVLYEKTEQQMKEAYGKTAEILKYYGNYDGCEVIQIYETDHAMTDLNETVKIGGYEFSFSSSSVYPEHFLVYKDGEFYTMKEAAALELLPDFSIYRIAQIHGAIPQQTEMPYWDVEVNDDWFGWSAYKANLMGVMTGLEEDYFGAYENVSRAQFATMLYRMAKDPSWDVVIPYEAVFPDVEEGLWYTDAVLWANKNNIIKGYENGYFGPADLLTREQMAVMLHRFAAYLQADMTKTDDLSGYMDLEQVSPFATWAIRWCVGSDIIEGNRGLLKPQDSCTRAECATMMVRFAEKYIYSSGVR